MVLGIIIPEPGVQPAAPPFREKGIKDSHWGHWGHRFHRKQGIKDTKGARKPGIQESRKQCMPKSKILGIKHESVGCHALDPRVRRIIIFLIIVPFARWYPEVNGARSYIIYIYIHIYIYKTIFMLIRQHNIIYREIVFNAEKYALYTVHIYMCCQMHD